MSPFDFIQLVAIWALPVLFAITVHEVAHGWVALRLGDKTALMLGRLTLNPIKHIDPIGTIAVPAILLFLGGVIFGWAKPVPVTLVNLRHPNRDKALVALAGPLANLVMALGWGLVAKLALTMHQWGGSYSAIWLGFTYMGQAGIMINIVLGVLNLIPIPPLDGSQILSSLMPSELAYQYEKIAPFGFFILLGLLAFGLLGKLLGPPVFMLYRFIATTLGL